MDSMSKVTFAPGLSPGNIPPDNSWPQEPSGEQVAAGRPNVPGEKVQARPANPLPNAKDELGKPSDMVAKCGSAVPGYETLIKPVMSTDANSLDRGYGGYGPNAGQ